MSHLIAGPAAYRTPFDFTTCGAITQNSTQLAQLRDRYGREQRALDQQEAGRQAMEATERDRYLASLQALRDRSVKAHQKEQKLLAARQDQKQLEAARTASIYAPIAAPNLLPFSSHFQRMPPPLLAQTARGHASRTQRSGQRTATARHRALPRTQLTLQQTWQHQQSSPPPPTMYEQVAAEGERRSVFASPESVEPRAQQFQPTPPMYQQQQQQQQSGAPNVRHGYGISGRSSSVASPSALPVPFNSTPGDRGVVLPYTDAQLLAMGHERQRHPFYLDDTRLANASDREYMRLLAERYPPTLQKHPDVVDAACRLAQEKRLPPGYDLNAWSVQWGSGIKKSWETKTQEILLAKRYI